MTLSSNHRHTSRACNSPKWEDTAPQEEKNNYCSSSRNQRDRGSYNGDKRRRHNLKERPLQGIYIHFLKDMDLEKFHVYLQPIDRARGHQGFIKVSKNRGFHL